ncbi:hypothetical protein MTR_1g052855 [Medicago truncatula]|uniref:Uncharacterized protein n=1 Tax=Medicago truncatula TaxID=3880 RepID=A0A072VIG4_MEDTR|nr:hypothetical protein MTR_1g052855 [Medicago truncatula]
MIKEWKDLEHDLELIQAKNMKIMCKNIRPVPDKIQTEPPSYSSMPNSRETGTARACSCFILDQNVLEAV